MKFHPLAVVPVTVTMLAVATHPAIANRSKAIEKIETATLVFKEIMSDSKTRIPPSVIRQSQGIAILPNVVQAGFVFGGRRGEGVLLLRQPDGSWSNPAFINITGGSFGLQFGAKSSDVVLVFRNRSSIEQVLAGKTKLGGTVSATAGPVGVEPTAERNGAPIYSYSRNDGLFAGAAVEGGELGINNKRNQQLYKRSTLTAREILSGTVPLEVPPVVLDLKQAINQAIAPRP